MLFTQTVIRRLAREAVRHVVVAGRTTPHPSGVVVCVQQSEAVFVGVVFKVCISRRQVPCAWIDSVSTVRAVGPKGAMGKPGARTTVVANAIIVLVFYIHAIIVCRRVAACITEDTGRRGWTWWRWARWWRWWRCWRRCWWRTRRKTESVSTVCTVESKVTIAVL